jgi:DNA-binding PadR family transcriptional regulator
VSPKGASGAKPITSSAFYILLALADQDRHGLGIAAEVASRTDDEVDLGTLYNAIKKMLQDGLIQEAKGPPDPADDDPRRRYYHITRSGRRALRAEAKRLARLLDAVREKNVLEDLSLV